MFYPSFLLVCLLAAVSLSRNPDYKPAIYYDALTVNGQSIDYNTIQIYSRGVLAFVEGAPDSPKRRPMQFRVTLRRAGTAIQQWPSKGAEGVYSVQLNDIWPSARLGDELVVEPVGTATPQEAYSRGARVIKLIGINWLFMNNC